VGGGRRTTAASPATPAGATPTLERRKAAGLHPGGFWHARNEILVAAFDFYLSSRQAEPFTMEPAKPNAAQKIRSEAGDKDALWHASQSAPPFKVKLDEIIRTSRAENLFVGIEYLTEEEIEELRNKCESRAKAKRRRSQEVASNNN
jgi:Low affinity iron permease